jgi:hypothetical protein
MVWFELVFRFLCFRSFQHDCFTCCPMSYKIENIVEHDGIDVVNKRKDIGDFRIYVGHFRVFQPSFALCIPSVSAPTLTLPGTYEKKHLNRNHGCDTVIRPPVGNTTTHMPNSLLPCALAGGYRWTVESVRITRGTTSIKIPREKSDPAQCTQPCGRRSGIDDPGRASAPVARQHLAAAPAPLRCQHPPAPLHDTTL